MTYPTRHTVMSGIAGPMAAAGLLRPNHAQCVLRKPTCDPLFG